MTAIPHGRIPMLTNYLSVALRNMRKPADVLRAE